MENTTQFHPSYGILCFNRRHSNNTALFGSNIHHNETIALTVKHAELDRTLNCDKYHGTDTILDIEMSYAQFAEAITSFGMYSGVPVTIRYTEKNGHITKPNFINKQKQFEDEFSEQMHTISKNVTNAQAKIQELLTKKTLNKSDKEEILQCVANITREWNDNIPYIYTQFNEQMEKTLTEAKIELEAFTQNRLNSIYENAISENPEILLQTTKFE